MKTTVKKTTLPAKRVGQILYLSFIVLTIVNVCFRIGLPNNSSVDRFFETLVELFSETLREIGIFILITISQIIILRIKERKRLFSQTKLKLSIIISTLEIAKPATTLGYMSYYYILMIANFYANQIRAVLCIITIILLITIMVLDIIYLKRIITAEIEDLCEGETAAEHATALISKFLIPYYIFYVIEIILHCSEKTAFGILTSGITPLHIIYHEGFIYCFGSMLMSFVEGGLLIALSLIQLYILVNATVKRSTEKQVALEITKLTVTAVYIGIVFAKKSFSVTLPLVFIWALSFISIIIVDLKFALSRKQNKKTTNDLTN